MKFTIQDCDISYGHWDGFHTFRTRSFHLLYLGSVEMHYLRDNNVCNPNEMRNYVAQIDQMFWKFEWKMKYSDPTQIVRPDTTFIFGHKSDANPERIPAAICLPLTLFSQKSPNPIYLTQTLGRTRRFKARQILSDSENVRGRTFWLTNFSKSATSKNLFICSKPLMCRLPTT